MYSTDTENKRKENTLKAHRILLKLDHDDFQGVVRFSFKKGEGLKTYTIEQHGTFNEKDVLTTK